MHGKNNIKRAYCSRQEFLEHEFSEADIKALFLNKRLKKCVEKYILMFEIW